MSVRDKLSQREYGFNPAINPGSSFQDFIRTVPDYSIGLQHVVKHSEFKRPYDSSSYQDMEYQWDSVPGIPPYRGGGQPDFPWVGPGPVPGPAPGPGPAPDFHWPDIWPTPPPSDPGDDPDPGKPQGGKTIVFNCWANDKYLMCTTTNIVFNCTQKCRWIKLKSSVPSGYTVSAKCSTISITAPECDAYGNVGPDFKFTIFTIAPNGEGFESDITIKPDFFSCEGEACNKCDDPVPSIGYTTQQMSVDETQNLTVQDSKEGATYTWVVTSGGGSVDPGTGASTIYTAPSSNAECANNPTITLSCDGSPVDTLQIAVNAYGNLTIVATRTWVDKTCECKVETYDYCSIINISYNCEETIIYGPCKVGVMSEAGDCDKCPGWCDTPISVPGCWSGNYSPNQLEGMSPMDQRYGAMLTAGCCPEQAL